MNIEEVIDKKLEELVQAQEKTIGDNIAFYTLQGQIDLLFEIIKESKKGE